MAGWLPVHERSKYGVVIANFKDKGSQCLNLIIGETVHIMEENEDWYRGFNPKDRSKKGIFPKSYVLIKEAIITKTGTYDRITPKEPPIVQEITSVLREWGHIWKNQYMNSEANSEFENLKRMMLELIDYRRRIMSKKLTLDEMKEAKRKVTSKIDMGNALLGLDLVIRDEDGNILVPSTTSAISMYRQHVKATERIQTARQAVSARRKIKSKYSFNLYVNVKNFVCRIGEDSDVLMTLYDAKNSCFLSENYLIEWGPQGMPRDIKMLDNLRVLFTDLGSKDAQRERVYLICQVIRIGTMDMKDADTKKLTKGLRRAFGVAAMDVTDIMRSENEIDDDKQHFIPFLPCGDKESLDSAIKRALGGKEINHKSQGLWVTLRKLHGDIKQVREDFPHLLGSATTIARKMGFPEVILPSDVRNDLYVTINIGEFIRGAKTADKNVQVTMTVCNDDGKALPKVICVGGGSELLTEYRSVVYYHEDKPRWYETVKVSITIEEFYKSHLKFTFKHRSSSDNKDKGERPFEMAFVRLMQDNGTTLSDSIHNLLVYQIDSKKADTTNIYLNLPATKVDLERSGQLKETPYNKVKIHAGPLSINTKDSFSISTLVCSTKLTHNVDLMGLLKWREKTGTSGLKNYLLALMKVDGEEVVKFLQDVLDEQFSILMQNSEKDTYDYLVFDALIFIIGLIAERKYQQFSEVLNVYIKENFSATLAYKKLMTVLKSYVDKVQDRKNHDVLYKSMKALEYIFKFIIRSRSLFASLSSNQDQKEFEASLGELFESLTNMMKFKADNTLLVQGAALKYLPSTLSDLMTVCDKRELSNMLVRFIQTVPADRLTKQKMLCLNDIVHSDIFLDPDCRDILLPVMCENIKHLLERGFELDVCVVIMSDILEVLHVKDAGPTDKDITMLVLAVMRTVIQTVIHMNRNSPLIGNYVAVTIGMLRQMKETHYLQYVNNFPTNLDLLDFLMEILMVFRDLVDKNCYPSDWSDMVMMENSVILKSLRYFSHTIRDKFSTPFEYQLWNNFFHCAISFMTQKPLQLEQVSSSKRAKIVSEYKDMRRETGFEIRSMWFNLGHNKIQFVPSMVGPLLEMTLLSENELRKATIPIFFDMMQCEFTQSVGGKLKSIKGNFEEVEHEIITQLDILIEGGRGDTQYKDLFYKLMHGQCENHSTMREQGLVFVEIVKNLLQRLLEYRDVIDDENKENRMMCTVNLLNFYHDINRQEMYIRYLHKLCDLHLECDNYTEAANTLMLYAKLLKWSNETLPTMFVSDRHPNCRSHRSLKEVLYYDIIGYYDKGKMWERGIELCKELISQYEEETFDYNQLSKLLVRYKYIKVLPFQKCRIFSSACLVG
ncbi:unnamed protein product [Owenia fusiformis]|uniref:Dedicator of cytokinesis protein 1 n=1 Tax=Owenia fusiformis TaxID=6347 RepID=A0A8S4NRL0_OWEFU|nr:unnamed protein product [Owenia fusiformis]